MQPIPGPSGGKPALVWAGSNYDLVKYCLMRWYFSHSQSVAVANQ